MKIPTREEFINIIEKANKKGQEAGEIRYQYLVGPDVLGGALLILNIDEGTEMGKFIRTIIDTPIPNASISYSKYYSGFLVHINDLGVYREKSLSEAAQEAALKVIKDSLGVDGYVCGVTE